jgi:transposase
MGRTEVLQEIRMLRFEEIHDRFGGGRLSAVEAAEWLGVSERTFRRQRVRFEEAGLAGLLDRRLGKPSPHRVPVDETARVLEMYRTRYVGWPVKHFHDHLVERHGIARSYGWTKSVLHASGLVRPAPKRSAHRRKRPRRPVPGMLLHQACPRAGEAGPVGRLAASLAAGAGAAARSDRHDGRCYQRDLLGLPGRGGRHRQQLLRAA